MARSPQDGNSDDIRWWRSGGLGFQFWFRRRFWVSVGLVDGPIADQLRL
jgi:hypothetical protein